MNGKIKHLNIQKSMNHSSAYEYDKLISQLSQNQSFGGSRKGSLL